METKLENFLKLYESVIGVEYGTISEADDSEYTYDPEDDPKVWPTGKIEDFESAEKEVLGQEASEEEDDFGIPSGDSENAKKARQMIIDQLEKLGIRYNPRISINMEFVNGVDTIEAILDEAMEESDLKDAEEMAKDVATTVYDSLPPRVPLQTWGRAMGVDYATDLISTFIGKIQLDAENHFTDKYGPEVSRVDRRKREALAMAMADKFEDEIEEHKDDFEESYAKDGEAPFKVAEFESENLEYLKDLNERIKDAVAEHK